MRVRVRGGAAFRSRSRQSGLLIDDKVEAGPALSSFAALLTCAACACQPHMSAAWARKVDAAALSTAAVDASAFPSLLSLSLSTSSSSPSAAAPSDESRAEDRPAAADRSLDKLLRMTDLSKMDEADLALRMACASGDRETVCSLLTTGRASVRSKDKFGHTPLHEAAARGQTEMIKLLVVATGQREERRCTPLDGSLAHSPPAPGSRSRTGEMRLGNAWRR